MGCFILKRNLYRNPITEGGGSLQHIVRISDGLGNQMFQYAFARKLQAKNRVSVYLDTRFINNEDAFERGERSQVLKNCSYRNYGLDHFRITLPVADESLLNHWDYLNQRNPIEKIQYNLAKSHLWAFQYKDENKLKKKAYIS